jgi:hypothetical protein
MPRIKMNVCGEYYIIDNRHDFLHNRNYFMPPCSLLSYHTVNYLSTASRFKIVSLEIFSNDKS